MKRLWRFHEILHGRNSFSVWKVFVKRNSSWKGSTWHETSICCFETFVSSPRGRSLTNCLDQINCNRLFRVFPYLFERMLISGMCIRICVFAWFKFCLQIRWRTTKLWWNRLWLRINSNYWETRVLLSVEIWIWYLFEGNSVGNKLDNNVSRFVRFRDTLMKKMEISFQIVRNGSYIYFTYV